MKSEATISDDHFTTYDRYNAEYQSTVASFALDLPDGFAFPEDAPGDQTENAIYQMGAGEVAAHLIWVEDIENAAVAAHLAGNKDAAHYLLAAASKFPGTDTFSRFNDNSAPISWYDHLIGPAIAGDFTSLTALVDNRTAA